MDETPFRCSFQVLKEFGRPYGASRLLPVGRILVLSEDDPAELPLPSSHMIEVAEFLPAGAVDPGLFDIGLRAHCLLRDAMTDTGRVRLGRVTIRTRERLALPRPYGQGIGLATLLWPWRLLGPPTRGAAGTDRCETRRPAWRRAGAAHPGDSRSRGSPAREPGPSPRQPYRRAAAAVTAGHGSRPPRWRSSN
ncbi:Ku protein [Saccharopolyspora shandongensis]|uniref:Ku protein n=1 Tax=Saccharopolyspora shandongensis TaxID=418495 RepID=UPI00340C4FC3